MIPTKRMTPHVPVCTAEIIEETLRAAELGVSIVHLHARDDDETPTHRPDAFAAILEGIRAHDRDVILCVTTSGRARPELEYRAQVLELTGNAKPDMASLTLSSLNFPRSASCNAPDVIKGLAIKMRENGIKPELEVFDLGMVNYARYLIGKGLLEPPYYFNLLFGNVASAQADLLTVGHVIHTLPPNSIWALAGIGEAQLPMNAVAVAAGGHVRVGLEDNIFFDEGRTRLATNEMLIRRVLDLARAVDRPIATPAEVRALLGLNQPSQASDEITDSARGDSG